ncbi:MAG TPA: hypothetical protein VJ925_05665 [Longimicrobiales bacterium]|nr:hypothetical protein [Longimicrobiales bacterium]
MKTRFGFTVIELLVVVVIGTLVVLGTLQVLTTNRRTYTVQNADLQNQQQLRASLDVLLAELRQVSSRGGDIIAASENSIQLRSMDDFGVVCEVNASSLGILSYTGATPFGVEPLLVFVDRDPLTSIDDTWELWSPGVELGSSALTTGTCDGSTSQVVDVQGDAETAVQAGSVLVGAPVRNFDVHTWAMSDGTGDWFLTLDRGGGPVEVVGPLAPDSRDNPLSFTYFDENGAEITSPSTAAELEAIRQIEVTVAAWSPVRNRDGTNVQDDLTVSVYTRN